MQIHFVLLLSRQGKVRLAKWYTTYTQKERAKVLTCKVALHMSNPSYNLTACTGCEGHYALSPGARAEVVQLSGLSGPQGSRSLAAPKYLAVRVLCRLVSACALQIVYKRYASLYFVMGIEPEDNELITLEVIHHYVEVLDRYFGNVCELDLIFNFHKACVCAGYLLNGLWGQS